MGFFVLALPHSRNPGYSIVSQTYTNVGIITILKRLRVDKATYFARSPSATPRYYTRLLYTIIVEYTHDECDYTTRVRFAADNI